MDDCRVRPRGWVGGAGAGGGAGVSVEGPTSADSQFTRLAVAWGFASGIVEPCVGGELVLVVGFGSSVRLLCKSAKCPSWSIGRD